MGHDVLSHKATPFETETPKVCRAPSEDASLGDGFLDGPLSMVYFSKAGPQECDRCADNISQTRLPNSWSKDWGTSIYLDSGGRRRCQ